VLTVEIIQGEHRRTACVSKGTPLLHALFESGATAGQALCAGVGLCGKCRVRFLDAAPPHLPEEEGRLTTDELAAGWRLACRHEVLCSCRLEVLPIKPAPAHAVSGSGLAVDIGTTRIKWTVTGSGVEHALVNPQMGAGSEVMSRLYYALASEQGAAVLRKSVLTVLEELLQETGASNLAVAGNSVMIALLVQAPLSGLAFAPYRLPWNGGQSVHLSTRLPDAYIPPLLAPFVGADISAGLAAMRHVPRPFLLVDLGTNGEFVLALDDSRFFVTSVPMGPAIEGVGLCCGAMAGPQVLTRIETGPGGLSWQAEEPVEGISGSGYASLLAALLRLGVLSVDGHFQDGTMPLARRVAVRVKQRPEGRALMLTDQVFLAERDIEEFLKVKAGVNYAVQTLIERAGLRMQDLRGIYLAGALGEHIEAGDLCRLGFFPETARDMIQLAGNTALAGTLLALENESVREWLEYLTHLVTVETLVDRDDFAEDFVRAMRFEWI
jgi:uncharacterized 2Fe-2S/4Fe-4S cluster protein (DUF4445 family)